VSATEIDSSTSMRQSDVILAAYTEGLLINLPKPTPKPIFSFPTTRSSLATSIFLLTAPCDGPEPIFSSQVISAPLAEKSEYP